MSAPSVQRRTVTVLSVAQILSGLAYAALIAMGTLLGERLSGTTALAGMVTVAATLGSAVAAPNLVRLVHVGGRRLALSTGYLVSAVGFAGVVLAAVAGSFVLLLVAALLAGAATASGLQARFAATDHAEPRHRGRDLSVVVWMATIGSVAGPNLVGLGDAVEERFGMPDLAGLFPVSVACALLAALVVRVGLPSRDRGALTARRGSLREGLRTLRAHPQAAAALVAIVVGHAVMVGVMSLTPVHLKEHGASITVIGLTVSLHIAGMYVLSPVFGMLADRIGARLVALAGLVVLVAAALIAGLSGMHHMATLVGLILLGLGWSAATVAGSAMLVAALPVEDRIAAQGASDTFMSLGGAAGGLLAGLAVATIGYSGLGIVAGALTAAVVVALAARRTRIASPSA